MTGRERRCRMRWVGGWGSKHKKGKMNKKKSRNVPIYVSGGEMEKRAMDRVCAFQAEMVLSVLEGKSPSKAFITCLSYWIFRSGTSALNILLFILGLDPCYVSLEVIFCFRSFIIICF